jgi:hypothetical protein
MTSFKKFYLTVFIALFSSAAVLADTAPGPKPSATPKGGFSITVDDHGISMKGGTDDHDPLDQGEDDPLAGKVRVEHHHPMGDGVRDWEDIVVPLGFFAMIAGVLFLRNRARVKIAQARMETIKILAEKGVAIPQELLTDSPGGKEIESAPRTTMNRAIAQIGIGAGFILYFFATDRHGGMWAIGVGFLIMGIGKIWYANSNKPKH